MQCKGTTQTGGIDSKAYGTIIVHQSDIRTIKLGAQQRTWPAKSSLQGVLSHTSGVGEGVALMRNVAAPVIPLFAAGMLLWAVNAAASWPSQPIRWIVPFPPGGGTDFVARLIGNHLDKLLGQPIIVENKPGGATVTGTAALVQAAPDGHTVGMVFDSLAINAALG